MSSVKENKPINTTKISGMAEYFSRMIIRDQKFPALTLLEKPCGDCAVECGLYVEISDALSKEPKDIQKKVSEKWFCHNNSKRSCRGNFNYLESKGTSDRPDPHP